MTWVQVALAAFLALALWGCISTLNRVREAETHIRDLIVFWWCQANPGKPLPKILEKRK